MTREDSMLLDEPARHIGHPFRQSLPIELFQLAQAEHGLETAAPSRDKNFGDDASLFLLSFIAFFTAFYTFIF